MKLDLPFTSVILLSGGMGSRMNQSLPKQYLSLLGKPIIHYSLEIFSSISEIDEIIVVCEKEDQKYFTQSSKPITFAQPGERRQDSVFNGLQATSSKSELICVHDGARPFISTEMVLEVLKTGYKEKAAVVGVPVKFTVKIAKDNQTVETTPDRSKVWEIQTPQVVEKAMLIQGFKHAETYGLDVTDDVSLVEHLGLPVKLVMGSYSNLKITTPEDLLLAKKIAENLRTKEIQFS